MTGKRNITLRGAAALLLAAWLLCSFACADGGGGDGFYDLASLAMTAENETAVLLLNRTYYSGDTIYKGSTGKPLNGACALHCAAVLISNIRQEAVAGQRVAKANNRDIRREMSWTPFVSWGKIASAFDVKVRTANMAQFTLNLKRRKVSTADRRARKMTRLVEICRESAMDCGLVIHFNSSGRLNGSGDHRHAVVLVGYIERDGQIVDLLVNDSSIVAPLGACVRMSASSLPESILGKKKVGKAAAAGDNLAMILMDYAVSCRWMMPDTE